MFLCFSVMFPYGCRSVLLGCVIALLVILSGFARLCFAFPWIPICFASPEGPRGLNLGFVAAKLFC